MATINVVDVKFETADKHRKGIATEESALRIIAATCKSLKVDFLQRVIPPHKSNVGECDAIVFTDAGILLVEVKRIGGNIARFNLEKEKLTVEKGKSTSTIDNPVFGLRRRVGRLQEYVQSAPEWRKLNSLFQYATIAQTVPVFPVLCFGPSTSYDIDSISDPNFIVCSTRTMRLQLRNFLESKRKVLGAYRHAQMLAFNWRIQGRLTVASKPGFIRVVPTKTYGVVTSFVDACEISGKRSGIVTVKYRDKTKRAQRK